VIIRTRSRHEKILANRIQTRNGVMFLPFEKVRRRYGGLDATVECPLFTGILFFKGDAPCLTDPELARCISAIEDVPNQDQLAQELKSIAIAIDRGVPLRPHAYLRQTLDVEIISGPLTRSRAVVPQIETSHPLLLQISAAQLAFEVMDEFEIRPIKPAPR